MLTHAALIFVRLVHSYDRVLLDRNVLGAGAGLGDLQIKAKKGGPYMAYVKKTRGSVVSQRLPRVHEPPS
jgi:hypothetical protein